MDEAVGHTPGPWNSRQHYNSLQDEIGVRGKAIAVVWVRKSQRDDTGRALLPSCPEGEANARLIAAAPCLLSALQAILAEVTPGIRPHSTDSYLPQHLIDVGLAAVAKVMP